MIIYLVSVLKAAQRISTKVGVSWVDLNQTVHYAICFRQHTKNRFEKVFF